MDNRNNEEYIAVPRRVRRPAEAMPAAESVDVRRPAQADEAEAQRAEALAARRAAAGLTLNVRQVEAPKGTQSENRTANARIEVKPAQTNSNTNRRRVPPAGARYKKRRRTPIWAPVLTTLCLAALFCVGYVGYNEYDNYQGYVARCQELNTDTFYDGITLEGESIGGLTYQQALERFNARLDDISNNTQISVRAAGRIFELGSGSVQMSTDIQSTLSKAYSVGRSGSFDERYQRVQQLKSAGLNFTLSRGWNEETLRASIKQIADAIYVKGTDATVRSFDPSTGKFTFSSEITGFELDTEDLYTKVTQAIANGDYNATIEAKVNTVVPKYNVAYLEEHWGRVSSATTVTTSNADRNRNIQLAAACFNGMRVEPGETVSFNSTTGERTEDKGYKPAGAYKDGILIAEPGGGVCQVSTTLYHAVVKADLEIVARSPHSRVSNYVGIGQDAAVNWPSQDFKFKNNTEFPIYIVSEFADMNLTFKIYGYKLDNGEYIKIESEKTEDIPALDGVREKYDDTLPVGKTATEAARDGARATSYKVRYDSDGNIISREILATSYYPPSQAVKRIGTGTGN